MRRVRVLSVVALVGALLSGCGGDTSEQETATTAAGSEVDEALREELLAMMERDQAGRTGGEDTEGDQARTDRLEEILDEHGWPTVDLVGEDGSEAAWVIAQHSDLDPQFQEEALELLRAAAEDGQASRGDLAYLEDRVRLNTGREQLYGTQAGCTDGVPAPAPLEDPDGVEERRAEAGLESLADYLAELEEVCAEEVVEP